MQLLQDEREPSAHADYIPALVQVLLDELAVRGKINCYSKLLLHRHYRNRHRHRHRHHRHHSHHQCNSP